MSFAPDLCKFGLILGFSSCGFGLQLGGSFFFVREQRGKILLLVKPVLPRLLPEKFAVERFAVNVERRYNALGELVTFSEAIVKVRVGDELLISAAEGDSGPVNALDIALRKDLGRYQSLIGGLRLVDYKVRIFQGGTDAVPRVLIELVWIMSAPSLSR